MWRWGPGDGGRGGSKLSSDLCQASGGYKIPLGPGSLKSQLPGPGHPVSLHLLFLFPSDSAMGLSDGEWQLVLNAWGKVEADIPGHGQAVLIR